MYHAATSFLSNCLLQFWKRETMWIHLKALFKIIIAQDEVWDYSLANKRIEITRWRDNFDQYNEIKESFWVYRVINSYRACVTDIINVCKTMLPVSVLGPQQTQQINYQKCVSNFLSSLNWQIDNGFFNRPIILKAWYVLGGDQERRFWCCFADGLNQSQVFPVMHGKSYPKLEIFFSSPLTPW